jgi:hypothetical protein
LAFGGNSLTNHFIKKGFTIKKTANNKMIQVAYNSKPRRKSFTNAVVICEFPDFFKEIKFISNGCCSIWILKCSIVLEAYQIIQQLLLQSCSQKVIKKNIYNR